MGWLLLCVMLGANDDARIAGNARQAESVNFRVDCRSARHDAREVARLCEDWRTKMLQTWRSQDERADWQMDCLVVVHSSRASYVAAVGRGGNFSLGSSWIEYKQQVVSKRQIDLLPGELGELSALGHEMTHVVVADYFGGKQLPRWADEGMAILADSSQKRRLHQRDLQSAIVQRQSFHAAELLAVTDYPAHARIPAFYGQSASLVAYLCRRESPAKFLEFVQLAMQQGHEHSIREVYGIAGHAELEQLWRADLAAAVDFHGFQLALAGEARQAAATP